MADEITDFNEFKSKAKGCVVIVRESHGDSGYVVIERFWPHDVDAHQTFDIPADIAWQIADAVVALGVRELQREDDDA